MLLLLPTGRDVHFFVDEFVVNDDQDLETIDDISAKIDLKNHAWITVAKASKTQHQKFEVWLEKKITEGYREPSLQYPLRNSKEIIKFEKSLASNGVDSENTLASTADGTERPVESNITNELLDESPTFNPNSETPEPTIRIQAYALPRPMTELKVPVNLTCGDKVCIEVHDETNEDFTDALKRCFMKLPAQRVLIITLAEVISSDFITAVEKARNRRPLVIDRNSQLYISNSNEITQIREYELSIRKWLVDLSMTQDLIASSCVIAGFEWASVLIITNDNHKSQFYARNMVMRAMSRLVWLKTNSLTEVNELEGLRPVESNIINESLDDESKLARELLNYSYPVTKRRVSFSQVVDLPEDENKGFGRLFNFFR